MRKCEPFQIQLGEVAIEDIQLDPKSRDDVPKLLRGLQHVYVTDELREAVFALLNRHIQPEVSQDTGRPGMNLWRLLVMGVLRLDLNWDYDHLQEQVNQHRTIRQMLGHSQVFDMHYYHLQTLKDNVKLLTPELLDEVNQVIVNAGHGLVKKKEQGLRGRCDSFVVETNVHYPTDINLLFDAMRKVIGLIAKECAHQGLSTWRQQGHTIRCLKRLMRQAQVKKRGGGKTDAAQAKRHQAMMDAHRKYIELAQYYLTKAQRTLAQLQADPMPMSGHFNPQVLSGYMDHATRQIDQIRRRVLAGETICHDEKVFSIFEPHTQWVSKGKAGVPVELGLKVCVLEDQHQFILHHEVMENQTDEQIAIPMVSEAKARFEDLNSCSFDKGFYSFKNHTALNELLEVAALPRPGKRSEKVREWESSLAYQQARGNHSAVESAINSLEHHGLDRCPDHGLAGFKRYVGLSIVARNLQRLGDILTKQEQKRLQRRRRKRLKQAA